LTEKNNKKVENHKTQHTHKTKTHQHHVSSKEKDEKSNIWTIVLSVVAIIAIGIFIVNMGKLLPKPDQVDANLLVTVDGKEITVDDLNAEIAKLPEYYKQAAETTEFKENILEQMIVKELLVQKATELELEVSSSEVVAKIEELYLQMGITEEEFKVRLAEEGLTYDELVANYREQLLLNKLIESELGGQEPTEEEIKAYYDANKDTLTSVKASHILVCYEGIDTCEKERTEEEALTIIEEVIGKAKAGDDFAELAKEYSDGPSAPMGGDLGWFGRGMMVPEFENTAFDLNVDEVSEAVKTSFGYHVIKVAEKKSTLEDLKNDIIESVTNTALQTEVGTYIEDLKTKAKVVYVNSIDNVEENTELAEKGIGTFSIAEGDLCLSEDGKPLVFMFSTTTCPHCKWIKATYDGVVKEYVEQGKIEAYHWEFDTKDNTITEEIEKTIPQEHEAIFSKFNSYGGVPSFVFGCRYHRLGNGYEVEGDLVAEDTEFRKVIDELLEEVSGETTPAIEEPLETAEV